MKKYTKYIISIIAGIIVCTGCASSNKEIKTTTQITTEVPTKETTTQITTEAQTKETATQKPTQEITSDLTIETKTEVPTKETATEKATKKIPVEKTAEYYDEQFTGDCFIGDSRTQGLFNTSQIITADFLCSVGQNISDVRTDEKTLNHLKTKKYRNVYIEFGINEMGWSDVDKFEKCYEEFVNIVKQYQPNAKIYVQGVIPVTKAKSDSNQNYAPNRVNAFDERIKNVAKKTEVNYLDVAIGICGESRVLPEDVAPDGVHMGKYYNDKWLDYIIENRED